MRGGTYFYNYQSVGRPSQLAQNSYHDDNQLENEDFAAKQESEESQYMSDDENTRQRRAQAYEDYIRFPQAMWTSSVASPIPFLGINQIGNQIQVIGYPDAIGKPLPVIMTMTISDFQVHSDLFFTQKDLEKVQPPTEEQLNEAYQVPSPVTESSAEGPTLADQWVGTVVDKQRPKEHLFPFFGHFFEQEARGIFFRSDGSMEKIMGIIEAGNQLKVIGSPRTFGDGLKTLAQYTVVEDQVNFNDPKYHDLFHFDPPSSSVSAEQDNQSKQKEFQPSTSTLADFYTENVPVPQLVTEKTVDHTALATDSMETHTDVDVIDTTSDEPSTHDDALKPSPFVSQVDSNLKNTDFGNPAPKSGYEMDMDSPSIHSVEPDEASSIQTDTTGSRMAESTVAFEDTASAPSDSISGKTSLVSEAQSNASTKKKLDPQEKKRLKRLEKQKRQMEISQSSASVEKQKKEVKKKQPRAMSANRLKRQQEEEQKREAQGIAKQKELEEARLLELRLRSIATFEEVVHEEQDQKVDSSDEPVELRSHSVAESRFEESGPVEVVQDRKIDTIDEERQSIDIVQNEILKEDPGLEIDGREKSEGIVDSVDPEPTIDEAVDQDENAPNSDLEVEQVSAEEGISNLDLHEEKVIQSSKSSIAQDSLMGRSQGEVKGPKKINSSPSTSQKKKDSAGKGPLERRQDLVEGTTDNPSKPHFDQPSSSDSSGLSSSGAMVEQIQSQITEAQVLEIHMSSRPNTDGDAEAIQRGAMLARVCQGLGVVNHQESDTCSENTVSPEEFERKSRNLGMLVVEHQRLDEDAAVADSRFLRVLRLEVEIKQFMPNGEEKRILKKNEAKKLRTLLNELESSLFVIDKNLFPRAVSLMKKWKECKNFLYKEILLDIINRIQSYFLDDGFYQKDRSLEHAMRLGRFTIEAKNVLHKAKKLL